MNFELILENKGAKTEVLMPQTTEVVYPELNWVIDSQGINLTKRINDWRLTEVNTF